MRWRMFGYGCCLAALAVGGTARADMGTHAIVNSRVLEIDYEVSEAALPLDSVRLWYTLDGGRSWRHYGDDEDRQSPFVFNAPEEGLFGFFLVLTNSTGSSSAAPTEGTVPQQFAYVDYTPPVVQLHGLKQVNQLGQRVLQIRWTAIDANLMTRPIEISYRKVPAQTWHPVAPDRVANTGRYDWRLPESLSGPIAVRVTAADKGGNRVDGESQVVELTAHPTGAPERIAAPGTGGREEGGARVASMPAATSKRASARAARLYADALVHRDRSEYRKGIARLREAVRLDPQMTDAFAEMAGMLYLLGDADKALSAYEIALSQQPRMRKALQGAARVYRQKHDYRAAAERLRTVLRYNPNDAEIWMNLGDIAVYQGDEILARECYTRATQIDPGATEIIASARKRLELMRQVSRTYRPIDR